MLEPPVEIDNKRWETSTVWSEHVQKREGWETDKTDAKFRTASLTLAPDKFPPHPDDRKNWNLQPDSLKPVVCRVVNGLANRLDRLQACGNGVVPAVAALAWRILMSKIMEQEVVLQ